MKNLNTLKAILIIVLIVPACIANAYTCAGIPYDDPAVCSGNGICQDEGGGMGICVCTAGYMGPECEYYQCYGQLSTDPAVCSGFGTCVAPDICACDVGYTGADCSTTPYQCGGIDSTDPAVCSSNGVCAYDGGSEGMCMCAPGYEGVQCQDYQCYALNSTDPAVCSGFGTCVAPDTCACDIGYTGPDCSTPPTQCYGLDENDPAVCSGFGSCVAPDTCACELSWQGSECQECIYKLKGDINQDCRTDIKDLAELASTFLIDCITEPTNIECVL